MSGLPLPLGRFGLSKREERRLLPWVFLACFLLVLYIQPHRLDASAYRLPFSSSSRDATAILPELDLAFSPDITPTSLAKHLIPRLERLRAAPILSYEASLEVESARCPTTHAQSNRDQLNGEGKEFWPRVSIEELREARERVVEAVVERFGLAEERKLVSEERLEEMLGNGERGLVFTAGNKDTMSRLLTSLRILRKRHGCTLPVEIFGFPAELHGLGEVKREIDALGGVRWREIEAEKVEGAWKQFQIKGEAIARSSFSEVLYLDSDNIALTDPSFLLSSLLYKKHGIVLWPDFNRDSAANPIWRLLNTPCDPSHWQAETGQLLVNKRAQGGLNLVALEAARAMQADSQFWFHLSGGDKDTFRYAFYFLSLPYSIAPHYPSALGGVLARDFRGHTFCGHTMLQYGLSADEWEDRIGETERGFEAPREHAPPLFAHANVLKHSGYNNRRGSTFLALKKPTDDRLFPPHSSSSSPSPAPLSHIRQTGLPHRGICVDIWDASSSAGESADEARPGAYEEGEVEVLDWRTAWGGIGRGLEEMYYDEGGVAGAW
ncbi:hypothetical protein JCM8097_006964 [Rhodosporidiobolus ruineniae]